MHILRKTLLFKSIFPEFLNFFISFFIFLKKYNIPDQVNIVKILNKTSEIDKIQLDAVFFLMIKLKQIGEVA